MTEPSTTYTYQQDKVRISASYRVSNGDLVLTGVPETVEIELNEDAVPAGTAERVAFLVSLIDALFRTPAPRDNYRVEVEDPALDPDRLREIQERSGVKGGAR